MQNPLALFFPTVAFSPILIVVNVLLNPILAADQAGIEGLPDCASSCALSFLATQSCPLTTTTCICRYLAYYANCTSQSCNATESIKALAPPVPYYIPSLTISIESSANTSCPAVPPQNPVFGSKSSSLPTTTEIRTGSTSATGREGGETTASSVPASIASASGEQITIDTSTLSTNILLSTSRTQVATSTTNRLESTSTTTGIRITSTGTPTSSNLTSTNTAAPARITNSSGAAPTLDLQAQVGSIWALIILLGLEACL